DQPLAVRQQPPADSRQPSATSLHEAIQQIVAARRIPCATYRLQFNGAFTFEDATAIVAYLDALGISDLYASPIFVARAGSTHGYDVCDPTQLNPTLGGEAAFERLVAALHERNMGLLLDIVPNHMGINDPCNAWWWDVLENGPSSPYASFFDIQWHPVKPELENRVLLPVLGDQYGIVLESRQLQLVYTDGAFQIAYFDHRFPVAPGSYRLILRHTLERLYIQEGEGRSPAAKPSDAVLELESILTALGYLPSRTETDPKRVAERTREKEIIKRRLAALYAGDETFRAALDATVADYNGREGDPRSMDLLDELVEAQTYRLAFWRVAGEEINYRRFFDINDLAAIRVEDPQIFDATHALIFRLLQEGKANSLRIDHPDGLYDPPTYFRRLQERYLQNALKALTGADEGAIQEAVNAYLASQRQQGQHGIWPLYVVAEKILSEDEPLPLDWAVYGTTGYDFLAATNALMVVQANRRAFDRIYRRFTDEEMDMAALTVATKMLIMREALASEISALSYELERIGERNRHYRDFTLSGLLTALREVIASLSVYRTYINPEEGRVSPRDRKVVQAAVRAAKRRRPGIDVSLFAYLEDTLLLRNLDQFGPEERARLITWIMRFQQLTGPVMAKGVEDTAFYRYYRLASLNEVGASPAVFGISVEDYHEENRRRAAQWPHTMLATSTHDNKRSEDVRARLNIISEMPDRWSKAVSTWARINAGKKREVDDAPAPDRNDEYLLYQTLVGAWPLAAGAPAADGSQEEPWGILLPPSRQALYNEFCERIVAYMQKAAKEAKRHTSWTNPDPSYDDALRSFVERVLEPSSRNRFLAELAPLARQVAYFGQFNALSQVVLKLTAPGVPDIYQGNELWDFSLVDPDNRRPVDYRMRSELLSQLLARLGNNKRGQAARRALATELLASSHDGRIKLYVTHQTLLARRERLALFADGGYLALEASGARAEHLCAFARRLETAGHPPDELLVVVPRLVYTLTGGEERPPVGAELWADTWVALPEQPAQHYHNLYTGATITPVRRDGAMLLPVGEALADFPVALLAPSGSP
ncbi:MAG TPA: malto-oligosyltrehalose synthase, partial [Caldilineaceae bacterium]|nr:malto-oligosyltrehalose synthase [Caldilineaceae bacterium]